MIFLIYYNNKINYVSISKWEVEDAMSGYIFSQVFLFCHQEKKHIIFFFYYYNSNNKNNSKTHR